MEKRITVATQNFKKGAVNDYILFSKIVKEVKRSGLSEKDRMILEEIAMYSSSKKLVPLSGKKGKELINELKKLQKSIRWAKSK